MGDCSNTPYGHKDAPGCIGGNRLTLAIPGGGDGGEFERLYSGRLHISGLYSWRSSWFPLKAASASNGIYSPLRPATKGSLLIPAGRH